MNVDDGSVFGVAEAAYNSIRAMESDVDSIAQNTGFKRSNIQKIKDHLFFRRHLLDRYVNLGVPAEMRRFDADMEVANAWRRLIEGSHAAADVELLKHEAAELCLMRRWRDASYSRAHERAQKRFPAPC